MKETHDPTERQGPSDAPPVHDESRPPLITADVLGDPEQAGRRVDRRRLLFTGAVTAAGMASSLAVASVRSQEATPAAGTPVAGHDMSEMATGPATNQGFTVFVPYQAQILQAAAARLIPTDEHGPGATEAGVVYFIDRQLAKENMGFRGKEYQLGPFAAGEPTQGDQSALPVRDRFRIGIFGIDSIAQERFGRGFVQCSPEEQDQILSDLEQGIPEDFGGTSMQSAPLTTAPTEGAQISPDVQAVAEGGAEAFFNLLLQWTMAGFFCDPVQGGNRDMVGWKLIGFPGAHISYFEQIEKYDQPFTGDYISLGQYQEQVGGGV